MVENRVNLGSLTSLNGQMLTRMENYWSCDFDEEAEGIFVQN